MLMQGRAQWWGQHGDPRIVVYDVVPHSKVGKESCDRLLTTAPKRKHHAQEGGQGGLGGAQN